MTEKPVIAAFDFDGTITYHDTLFPFILYCKGYLRTFSALIPETPFLVGYLLGLVSRQKTKERVLTRLFKGEKLEEIKKRGHAFMYDHLDKIVRPEALKRILWHKKQKHRCILVSASTDLYLESFAKAMEFDGLLSSTVQTDNEGRLTGLLNGKNCRGAEKVRRLLEKEGPRESFTLYAYGDSDGDKELLESADYAYYRKME